MSAPSTFPPEADAPATGARVIDFGATRAARRDVQRRAEIAARGFLWVGASVAVPPRGGALVATTAARTIRVVSGPRRD